MFGDRCWMTDFEPTPPIDLDEPTTPWKPKCHEDTLYEQHCNEEAEKGEW